MRHPLPFIALSLASFTCAAAAADRREAENGTMVSQIRYYHIAGVSRLASMIDELAAQPGWTRIEQAEFEEKVTTLARRDKLNPAFILGTTPLRQSICTALGVMEGRLGVVTVTQDGKPLDGERLRELARLYGEKYRGASLGIVEATHPGQLRAMDGKWTVTLKDIDAKCALQPGHYGLVLVPYVPPPVTAPATKPDTTATGQ